MKVLITGGTGFIGSYVVMELLRLDHSVTVLARNPNKVMEFHKFKNIEIIKSDITEIKLLEQAVQGKDACIHVALNYTKETGWEVLQDDTFPTVFLMGAATQAQVKHFIYTSSTAANDSLYMVAEEEKDKTIKRVTQMTKQHPATFYGATKAASENFLMAQSYLTPMKVNIIRPGYTFGNPVVKGASTQGDKRFESIVKSALRNEPISVIKNDGTQFIWAGDLAKLYGVVLEGRFNRKMYFGLSRNFTSWEAIAREAVKKCGSSSEIRMEDKGWRDGRDFWDVSDMKNDYGLEFDSWGKIKEHLDYYISVFETNKV
jgi:UDP-glucose 4-epimerase